MPKLEYDVCARCGSLFDDSGENGWWVREALWWHECDNRRPARIVVRKLKKQLGISGASNAALRIATGEFVAFLDHDERKHQLDDASRQVAMRSPLPGEGGCAARPTAALRRRRSSR